jgi:hypothetical protein
LFEIMAIPLRLFIVACVLAACTTSPSASPSPSPTASPSPVAEPTASGTATGWERHVVADAGFAISVPDGWAAVDLTQGELEQILEEMYAQFPGATEYRAMIDEAMQSGLAFMALDFSPEGFENEFITNVNVLSGEGAFPLSIFVAGNAETIESAFGVTTVQERVQLPVGEAVILHWELPDSHAVMQYYLVGRDRSFVVTFSRQLGEEYATLKLLFAAIMETFEVLP